MRNEILRITPAPVFLQAPTALCPNGSTSTFQVQGECSRLGSNGQPLFPITYTWTLTGPAVFAGNTGQSISGPATQQTIRSTTATTGEVRLTVTAQRAGFTVSIPLVHTLLVNNGSVWATAPNQPVCYFTPVLFTAREQSTDGEYTWNIHLNGQLRNDLIELNAGNEITVRPDQAGQLEATVSAGDACRPGQFVSSQTSVQVVSQIDGQYCVLMRSGIELYPNPADGEVEAVVVSAAQQRSSGGPGSSASTPDNTFQLTVYNRQGQPVHTGTTTTRRCTIDTRGLPSGLYYVRIRRGTETSSRHLNIQH